MSGHKRDSRRALLMTLAALLGASVVVLPAVASSEGAPPIQAHSYAGKNYWEPPTATVNVGGQVAFGNSSGVAHGVEWRPGNPTTPSCSGVPASEATSSGNWTGTCTFAQPGVYTFWCTVHHSEMTGTVTVNPNGTTTVTTTTQPTIGTTTTSAPGGAGQGGPSPSSESATGSSPLAGSASSAVKLASSQHGRLVRGSIEVSAAGAGGHLEVDLLAKSASLARAASAALVRVGKLALPHLRAGKTNFAVSLGSRARSALRRHAALALSVRMIVSPPAGAPLTVTRSVLVRS